MCKCYRAFEPWVSRSAKIRSKGRHSSCIKTGSMVWRSNVVAALLLGRLRCCGAGNQWRQRFMCTSKTSVALQKLCSLVATLSLLFKFKAHNIFQRYIINVGFKYACVCSSMHYALTCTYCTECDITPWPFFNITFWNVRHRALTSSWCLCHQGSVLWKLKWKINIPVACGILFQTRVAAFVVAAGTKQMLTHHWRHWWVQLASVFSFIVNQWPMPIKLI